MLMASIVGRTPWSAAGPLPGLRPEADEGVGRGPGVRPTRASLIDRGENSARSSYQ